MGLQLILLQRRGARQASQQGDPAKANAWGQSIQGGQWPGSGGGSVMRSIGEQGGQARPKEKGAGLWDSDVEFIAILIPSLFHRGCMQLRPGSPEPQLS